MPILPPSTLVRAVAQRTTLVGVGLILLYVATGVAAFTIAGVGIVFASVAAILWSYVLGLRETFGESRTGSAVRGRAEHEKA
jgi:uncharacterized protein YsxB (DUF464 family)